MPRRGFILRIALGTLGLLIALCGAVALVPALRHGVGGWIPKDRLVQLNGLRFGFSVERDVRIAMPDGRHLAASLYLPRARAQPLATVLVRLPYHRLVYGEGLNAAEHFARRGYAVVVEDLRGTGDSEGEFVPYLNGESDGAATLDWIAAQPWSNGRVGTFGCSALGETQYVLARAGHPAHRAMVVLGAGGIVGSLAGQHAYFGLYEGGVFELASGFGWFFDNGAQGSGASAVSPPVDLAAALRSLPVSEMMKRFRPGPNGFNAFVRRPLTDPSWRDEGFIADDDLPAIPALEVTTWGDQTVGQTLALSESLRRRLPAKAFANRHLILAPGTHCHHVEAGESGEFGELPVPGAEQPYLEWYAAWFDHWLRDQGNGLADLPPYLYYVMGEGRWRRAGAWPPEESLPQRWYLGGEGHANSRDGGGTLALDVPARAAHDEYRYDPMDPVPSVGGPVCCTGNPQDRPGPADQGAVEQRQDVLVYTSAPLPHPLLIAGPVRATLALSSSAPDTDVVARLVHVRSDGRAVSIQEGALRVRYRQGIDRPQLMKDGERVEINVDMRSIAYRVPAGDRLRLDITSSSFPRLERNLNTGGDNRNEARPVVARNQIHHGPAAPSYVELRVLPLAD